MHTNIAKSECGRVHGPNWLNWLGHLCDTPAVGMEIGTFEGDSAEWMCENIFVHPGSRYHCVDTFEGSDEHRLGGIDVSQLELTARAKLARFPQVVIHKGRSEAVVRCRHEIQILAGNFDAIYVDAGHSSRDVLRDSVLSFDLLKVGGVMIWDDYNWTVMPDELDRPKTGIDAFLRCYAKQLTVLEPTGWQVAFRKTHE